MKSISPDSNTSEKHSAHLAWRRAAKFHFLFAAIMIVAAVWAYIYKGFGPLSASCLGVAIGWLFQAARSLHKAKQAV